MYRYKVLLQSAKRWAKPVGMAIPIMCGSVFTCAVAEPFVPLSVPLPSMPVVLPVVQMAVVETKSLWEELVGKAEGAVTTVKDTVRYIQRVMTYLLYGAPLVGLVPATYVLGESFPDLENATWRYLVWAIQRLGPCFVKMAQWASTRPDLFPPALMVKLETLQDDVAVHHSMEAVERTLANAFGENWKERLSLDPKPLGTGSVAQVFRGVLKGVKEDLAVAVKLIHPHVEQLIRTDMELLTLFAGYIDSMPRFEILSLGETAREFAAAMNAQLDLRLEAHHLQVFNKKFLGEDWAVFPKPIEPFISRNVLVETLMEGKPIKDFMALDDISAYAKRLKGKLSDLGCRLILKMVFFDNYIHADLHPGNILVQLKPNGDPRLVVLDCGIVYSSPSEEEHRELSEICLAFMQHDGYRAGRLMLEKAHRVKLNKVLPATDKKSSKSKSKATAVAVAEDASALGLSHKEAVQLQNDEEFCQSIVQLVTDAESENYFEHMSEYLARICDLARKHNVRLDPGYFKIAMALKVAEGISLSFDRELDLITKCIPIVLKAQAMRKLGLTKFPAPEPDEIEDQPRRK